MICIIFITFYEPIVEILKSRSAFFTSSGNYVRHAAKMAAQVSLKQVNYYFLVPTEP